MDGLKELFKEWGLPTAGLPAFAWLWSAGLVHWMPLLLAMLLGFWVYALQKPLPIFPKQAESLKSITEGKNLSAQSLKRRVQRVAASMQAAQAALAGASSAAPRWQQSLLKTEGFFSQHLGSSLLTFKGFNALLLVALIYPLIFLLLAWVLTGEGRMGNAQVLPEMGADFLGFVKRLGMALGLVFYTTFPWLGQALAKRFRPHWYQAYAGQGSELWHELRWQLWMLCSTVFVTSISLALLLRIQTDAFFSTNIILIAFAGVTSFVGLFAFAGTVANSGTELNTSLITFAVALAATTVALNLIAVVIVYIGFLMLLLGDGSPKRNVVMRIQLFSIGLLCLASAGALTGGLNFSFDSARAAKVLPADKFAFILLLFFGILPLCNAIFDWLSVGFTRWCLRCMLAGRAWASVLVVLDAVVAVLLTFGLFALVLWILLGLQAAGWGIDGRAMLSRFAANPLDSQSSWIAMLALTNLLPTFWHLILSLWGWMGRYARPSADAAALIMALDQSLDAQGRPMAGATGHLLGESDRHSVYQTLYVEPWLVPLAIIGLVIAFWTQYVQSLGWLMRLVLAV